MDILYYYKSILKFTIVVILLLLLALCLYVFYYYQMAKSEIKNKFESQGFVVEHIEIPLSIDGVRNISNVKTTVVKQLWKNGLPTEVTLDYSLHREDLWSKFEIVIYSPSELDRFYYTGLIEDPNSNDEVIMYWCGKQFCVESKQEGVAYFFEGFTMPEGLHGAERWNFVYQRYLEAKN